MKFVRLYRIIKSETNYYLKEVSLNVGNISYMSENTEMRSMLREGKIDLELNKNVIFTNIHLNDLREITVIGSPVEIEGKILKTTKTLLRG